jgi:flagellar biosynthesis/type III secretory pathway M-ring protein FliF/YscJ
VTAVVIVIVAVVVVAIVVALVLRARRPDTVEVFQRQIDALSPEARKPVVEQLQQFDERGDDEVSPGPEESGPPPAEDDKGGG